MAELSTPVVIVLERVVMQRLVDAAMHTAIALFVAGEPFAADRHRPGSGLLGDGAVAAGAGEGHGCADEQLFDPGQLHAGAPC